jgi:hypothetical protein
MDDLTDLADDITGLEEDVAALKERITQLELQVGELVALSKIRTRPVKESPMNICALDAERDSAECSDATVYRHQQGCRGVACVRISGLLPDYRRRQEVVDTEEDTVGNHTIYPMEETWDINWTRNRPSRSQAGSTRCPLHVEGARASPRRGDGGRAPDPSALRPRLFFNSYAESVTRPTPPDPDPRHRPRGNRREPRSHLGATGRTRLPRANCTRPLAGDEPVDRESDRLWFIRLVYRLPAGLSDEH